MLPVQKGYVDFSSHHHIFCLDSFQLQKIIGFSYLNTITRWWQLKYFRNFHPETAGEDSWYFHFDLRTFFVAGWWKNPPNPQRFGPPCLLRGLEISRPKKRPWRRRPKPKGKPRPRGGEPKVKRSPFFFWWSLIWLVGCNDTRRPWTIVHP